MNVPPPLSTNKRRVLMKVLFYTFNFPFESRIIRILIVSYLIYLNEAINTSNNNNHICE